MITQTEKDAAIAKAVYQYHDTIKRAAVLHAVSRHTAKDVFVAEIERVMGETVGEAAPAAVERVETPQP